MSKATATSPTAAEVTAQLTELAQTANCSVSDVAFAQFLDARDPLANLRSEFSIPTVAQVTLHLSSSTPDAADSASKEQPCIYLCGNSLGLLPKRSRERVNEELDVWGSRGVMGHHDPHPHSRPWVTIDETVVGLSARLVGASAHEVAVMGTLTANLHMLMVSFYTPTPKRFKIMLEAKAFPSDHYAIESQIRFHGYDPADAMILLEPRAGEFTLRTEDILAAIEREGESIALVMFSGVQYYTGQYFDIPTITKAGQEQGCIVGFDLAHAAGNVPVQLHDWNVDFACWCSYKYLNSGPGGIAGLFVHERHLGKDAPKLEDGRPRPRFAGWWSHDKNTRFLMDNKLVESPGAAVYQLSNPSVLATVSLLGSLEVYAKTDMHALRAKSLLLTGYLQLLLDNIKTKAAEGSAGSRISYMTPRDPAQRGCQISILVPGLCAKVFAALEANGVICDKREPDCIRVAPVPLYNSFADVHRFVDILHSVLAEF
ncbi:kynureninase [Ramicandelaber brevisporus]|nr:kynureninase [Ramicandelaber brevisporus]